MQLKSPAAASSSEYVVSPPFLLQLSVHSVGPQPFVFATGADVCVGVVVAEAGVVDWFSAFAWPGVSGRLLLIR